MAIPVVGFAGYSGVGKTTLMEKVVRELKRKGLRIAVVKHDAHGFDLDQPEKDSWRYAQAGSDLIVLASPQKTAFLEQRELPLFQLLSRIDGVDLILVEGFKGEPLVQIGLCRQAAGKRLPSAPDRYVAIVTDVPEQEGAATPRFRFDQFRELADFIWENREQFVRSGLGLTAERTIQ